MPRPFLLLVFALLCSISIGNLATSCLAYADEARTAKKTAPKEGRESEDDGPLLSIVLLQKKSSFPGHTQYCIRVLGTLLIQFRRYGTRLVLFQTPQLQLLVLLPLIMVAPTGNVQL